MKGFIIGLVIGILVAAGACVYLSKMNMFVKSESHINEEVLREKLETCSELTSAKYQVEGQITRTESYKTGYSWLNQLGTKSFTVKYSATIAFAVDLAKAKISVDSNTNIVRIALPSATMQSLTIPSDSLNIVSETKSLINWENKNDMKEALRDAEIHALKTCDTTKMIRMANTEAVKTLGTLLCPLTESEDGEKAYQVIISIDGEIEKTEPLTIQQEPGAAK
ncbi:MAG: DUF4230 domain-containing protein [Bacteroidales bacterium]|nr:DUF4230 domain-containing protein [Bacteroidales bacterium]MBR4325739.1 DUF4230 domain-containing protein [Bacteroidales bacterium]